VGLGSALSSRPVGTTGSASSAAMPAAARRSAAFADEHGCAVPWNPSTNQPSHTPLRAGRHGHPDNQAGDARAASGSPHQPNPAFGPTPLRRSELGPGQLAGAQQRSPSADGSPGTRGQWSPVSRRFRWSHGPLRYAGGMIHAAPPSFPHFTSRNSHIRRAAGVSTPPRRWPPCHGWARPRLIPAGRLAADTCGRLHP
jgi:hypothetical protein